MVLAPTKRGVVYIAWGTQHVNVARRSAASVTRTNPDLRTAIFSHAEDDPSGFDHSFVTPEGLTRPKVDLLPESPFDETLYLDNDTLVRADLGSEFDLLEKFEMCGAHVMMWQHPRHNKVWKTRIPDSFPEINCGVLLYRKCDGTTAFFHDWSRAFVKAGFGIDQVTFRELLWHSDIRFYVFPPQFKKRIFEASELIWPDQPKPRILHLEILQPQQDRLLQWFSNLIR